MTRDSKESLHRLEGKQLISVIEGRVDDTWDVIQLYFTDGTHVTIKAYALKVETNHD